MLVFLCSRVTAVARSLVCLKDPGLSLASRPGDQSSVRKLQVFIPASLATWTGSGCMFQCDKGRRIEPVAFRMDSVLKSSQISLG